MVDEDAVIEVEKPAEAEKPSWLNGMNGSAIEEPPTEAVKEVPKPKKKGRPKGSVKKTKKVKKERIVLDTFGFRKGSARSKAAVLYSSPKGATLEEVKKKVGSVQYNMLTTLTDRGFKVTRKEVTGAGNRPATRFFLHAKKR